MRVLDALATFAAVPPDTECRFDQYLRATKTRSRKRRKRVRLFKAYGCIACHQGRTSAATCSRNSGSSSPRTLRVNPLIRPIQGALPSRAGERDRYVFRVPSLRNVGVTAPYFHDGSASTLEQAVTVMGRKQLGRILTEQDINLIVKFLHTLTGDYPGQPLIPTTEHPP